jgi:cobalt-zinc-cadmium efflux system membrane fusion protein
VRALLGQEVRKGDTLAEIDSIELGRAKAEFLQAKAKEELARRSFERERDLFADRIASEQEVLVAEAEFREATAALLTADETLHLYGLSQDQVNALRYDDPKTSIYPLRAPFAGTIVEKHATLGELVTPENNLFTLADLSRVWIWIDVYEKDLGQVHLEDVVQAHVEAYPGEAFRGIVSYLSAQVDVDTRTARARLDVANPDRKLRPGMFARVRLSDPHDGEGSTTLGKSLVVPSAAVQRDGDEFVVFAVDKTGTGRFERREVLVGRRTGDFVEVLSGLRAGEEVVVEGAFLLKSEASKESMGEGHTH